MAGLATRLRSVPTKRKIALQITSVLVGSVPGVSKEIWDNVIGREQLLLFVSTKLTELDQKLARIQEFRTPIANGPTFVGNHLQVLVLSITSTTDHESNGCCEGSSGCHGPQIVDIHVTSDFGVQVKVRIILSTGSHFAQVLNNAGEVVLVDLIQYGTDLLGPPTARVRISVSRRVTFEW